MAIILHHIHSCLRWIALLLLITSLIKSILGMTGNKPFTAGDKKLALFTLISMHTMLLVGLCLYVMFITAEGFSFGASMHDSTLRFFSVEHITAMILAIAFITIGYSKSKKASTDKAKFKKIVIFFALALLIIIAMVPWPFHLIAPVKGGWY